MLEAGLYESNSFVTLTYSDENLRFTKSGLMTLAPWDVQAWLKRFRTALYERWKKLQLPDETVQRVRFYCAGEYGDESWRPHYHLAIFNFETCSRGRTFRRPGSERAIWWECCPSCQLVGRTWGHGDVDLGILETSSALYMAGYVTKKLTRHDEPQLQGRHAEFSRMSNRPGIGGDAVHEIASTLMRYNLDEKLPDVPVALQHGSKALPLGRYLRRRLRKAIGKDEGIPQEAWTPIQSEMLDVQKTSIKNKRSFAQEYQAKNVQMVRNFKAREAIFRQRKGKL